MKKRQFKKNFIKKYGRDLWYDFMHNDKYEFTHCQNCGTKLDFDDPWQRQGTCCRECYAELVDVEPIRFGVG